MNGSLALKTAPAIDPITLTEIKAHCRIDISDDDTYLGTLIKAGTSYIEKLTGIRFVTQTWYYYLDSFPGCDCIELPIGPVSGVAVKYLIEGEVVCKDKNGQPVHINPTIVEKLRFDKYTETYICDSIAAPIPVDNTPSNKYPKPTFWEYFWGSVYASV
jgi:uncharacterized phiE125 gp8 family phage protein